MRWYWPEVKLKFALIITRGNTSDFYVSILKLENTVLFLYIIIFPST